MHACFLLEWTVYSNSFPGRLILRYIILCELIFVLGMKSVSRLVRGKRARHGQVFVFVFVFSPESWSSLYNEAIETLLVGVRWVPRSFLPWERPFLLFLPILQLCAPWNRFENCGPCFTDKATDITRLVGFHARPGLEPMYPESQATARLCLEMNPWLLWHHHKAMALLVSVFVTDGTKGKKCGTLRVDFVWPFDLVVKRVDAVKADVVLEAVLTGWESLLLSQVSDVGWLWEIRSSLDVENSLGKILFILQT